LDLGTAIEALRQHLGIADPFDLHKRLMITRSATDVHTVGEPKLAQRSHHPSVLSGRPQFRDWSVELEEPDNAP
jgi:hypothetical protein